MSLQKKKVEVIKIADKNPGMTTNSGTIVQLWKNSSSPNTKEQGFFIIDAWSQCSWEQNSNKCEALNIWNAEVNKAPYDWYILACSKNVYPTGPQLVEKAKQIAEWLG